MVSHQTAPIATTSSSCQSSVSLDHRLAYLQTDRLFSLSFLRQKSSAKIDSADRDDEAMLLYSLQDNVGSSASSASKSAAVDSSLYLSATEREQLTVENTALLSRLRTDIDAARELERSVARVGVLQRVFASKMAEQAEQIDHVHAVMGDARAAVSRGNEELIVATAHGVDFRIFVLMFLITMSVALLFLDWYQ